MNHVNKKSHFTKFDIPYNLIIDVKKDMIEHESLDKLVP